MTARRFPKDSMTPKLRTARLKAIKERMGVPDSEFARMLGIEPSRLWDICKKHTKTANATIMLLAEMLLERFLAQQAAELQASVPKDIQEDPEVCKTIMQLFAKGFAADSIAAQMALRPEIVRFYLSKLDAQ